MKYIVKNYSDRILLARLCSCSFWWYWRNCWLSNFNLSFHNSMLVKNVQLTCVNIKLWGTVHLNNWATKNNS